MSVVVHFVRHGESTWNVDRRLAGWIDVPLTDKGRAQAERVAAVLRDPTGPFAALTYAGVWSSDLARAYETSRIAGPRDATRDQRLRELNFGDLEGEHWEAFTAERVAAIKDAGFQAPGGESMDDLRHRVFAFLDGLPDGTHLIFAHGGVISAVLERVAERQIVANTAIVGVDWTSQQLLFIEDAHA